MIPASMGLRFQVPRDLAQVRVIASWGVYHRRRPRSSPRAADPGALSPGRRSTSRCSSRSGRCAPGRPPNSRCRTRSCCGSTVLRRRAPRSAAGGDRPVQRPRDPDEDPRPRVALPDRLVVDAEGADVFLPVRDALLDDRVETDDELRRLDLQFRNRLEFAIGRTCSADWLVAPAPAGPPASRRPGCPRPKPRRSTCPIRLGPCST